MSNSKINTPNLSEFDIDGFLREDNPQKSKTDLPELSESTLAIEQTLPDKYLRKTSSSKQRKSSLQEYQNSFLIVPKITDRKTVFISNELRDRIVDIVRKLGTEKSSVSGFIENLVARHLEEYKEDVENWKKL